MYYIGVDLGGTNIAAGLVDEKLNIVRKGSVPTNAKRPMDEIMKDMADLCKKLIADEGISVSDVKYAGIASPGTCDSKNGVVVYANNLNMKDYPIAARLSEYSGIENVYIDNDANAAAYAETICGAAKGAKNAIVITLGTGLGGGIIIDGKIYSGSNFAGGELGHTVIERNGAQCSCGRKGCWEAYSSATALIRMTNEAMEKNPDSYMHEIAQKAGKVSGRTAFDGARAGDKTAKAVVDEFISYLALGVGNMINIFQPEIFCIGGGICNEGEYLLAPLREMLVAETYGNKVSCAVEKCALGNDAGILGAAVLGITL
jgi:glucokinase